MNEAEVCTYILAIDKSLTRHEVDVMHELAGVDARNQLLDLHV